MQRLCKTTNIQWVCHHLHLDKAYTITPEILDASHVHMKEKWRLMRDIKEKYTLSSMQARMMHAVNFLVNQGCTKMRTFVDVDTCVGMVPLESALNVQKYWASQGVELQIGTQLLEGLECRENRELFEEAVQYVDFVGCLPSRDSNPEEHLNIVFDLACRTGKDVEAHLDQCNVPHERETELFCKTVENHGHQGKSRACPLAAPAQRAASASFATSSLSNRPRRASAGGPAACIRGPEALEPHHCAFEQPA